MEQEPHPGAGRDPLVFLLHPPPPPICPSLPTGCSSAIGTGTAIWNYSTYRELLYKPMHNYPESVAAELRQGLYCAMNNNPQDSMKHFRSALEQCAALGMDALSDEVTGIKIELAGMLEKHGLPDKTVTILEHVLDEVVVGAKAQPNGPERTRLMKKGVSIGFKLGTLYQDMEKPAEAEEALVWSVETALRERRRRETEGVKVEEEGEWFSDEETAMALENLAGYYGGNDQHFLATPLYLQALDLLPPNTCHAVIISTCPLHTQPW